MACVVTSHYNFEMLCYFGLPRKLEFHLNGLPGLIKVECIDKRKEKKKH